VGDQQEMGLGEEKTEEPKKGFFFVASSCF
jgi:hypothetical protein